MKFLKTLIFLLCCTPFFAQDQLEGLWIGTITQNDGGYKSEYRLEVFLLQDSNSVSGRSYVYVDSIYAEMNVAGQLHSGIYLQLKDEKILDHLELLGMEWCIKSYQLLLKQSGNALRLEGHWQGKTSFSTCIPGKIFLKKVKPRA